MGVYLQQHSVPFGACLNDEMQSVPNFWTTNLSTEGRRQTLINLREWGSDGSCGDCSANALSGFREECNIYDTGHWTTLSKWEVCDTALNMSLAPQHYRI